MTKILLIITALVMTACSSTSRYGDGEFEDATTVNLLDDSFNESHMQDIAGETVKQLLNECVLTKGGNKAPPIVAFMPNEGGPSGVSNNTSVMIDMKMLTSRMKVELLRSGRVRFVDLDARQGQENEYAYGDSGSVSLAHKKVRGKQISPEYFFVGNLSGTPQQTKKHKTTYYQFTSTLVHVESGEETCSAMREIRTRYKSVKD